MSSMYMATQPFTNSHLWWLKHSVRYLWSLMWHGNVVMLHAMVHQCWAGYWIEGPILEPPLSDSEDPQPSSPPCDHEVAHVEHGTPSHKHPAMDDASSSLTNVAQVIGSHSVSASTRCSLLTICGLQLSQVFFWTCFPTPVASDFPMARLQHTGGWWFLSPLCSLCFCRYCGSSPGLLVGHPLTFFKKAYTLRKHADKEHKSAIVRAEEFKKTMCNQQPTIYQKLSKSPADRIANNKKSWSQSSTSKFSVVDRTYLCVDTETVHSILKEMWRALLITATL